MKILLSFVFGNALWDYLVEYFGSTEAVVEAALIVIGLVLFIKFHKEIFGIALVIIILYAIFN